jgi:hypothetical protein
VNCERCIAVAPGYELFDFCKHCSKNLCDRCMEVGACRDSPDGRHHRSEDNDEPAAEVAP